MYNQYYRNVVEDHMDQLRRSAAEHKQYANVKRENKKKTKMKKHQHTLFRLRKAV
ncbi:hypothetical protein GMD78_04895 [Ornithinibacillus sp. L9]|uniref:Uncharacterized protein n=1 Tax=Ornithinibacillus caprae TaxID=2678566 RepID=A0A6N8FKB8_9BACI|nr:hypothetical protein [Ornithinibacillus caprae]MUK87738.1 hypothetical protein [Ornithinibacillus caprae]